MCRWIVVEHAESTHFRAYCETPGSRGKPRTEEDRSVIDRVNDSAFDARWWETKLGIAFDR